MKISIITSVFNNQETIADAIASVLSQTYPDIEYIIIDGGSTDGTVGVVKPYQDRLATFISEPDKGIYDGLNKGIKLATGDIIGFLHSDDLYEDNQAIEKVAQAFMDYGVDSVYGDLTYIDKNDPTRIIRYWQSGGFSLNKLRHGWMPPHPTFFVKRDVYERYGLFDTRFKIAADYDLILRFLGKQQISTHYIPSILIKMRVGGASNKNWKNILRKSTEDLQAMKNNGIGGVFSLVIKNLSKLQQFFRKA
ncbi:glycosyltransferase family 2 protein [Methylovulum miyakonense]|uniref:glycosyltransferase family 2 protein n=1 Tax=Methylovulum miyakonense TaxID=645578 RepID=UPI00037D80F0|nr:glycosyltransferase family 2 protein [Methylovulum miyakonense]